MNWYRAVFRRRAVRSFAMVAGFFLGSIALRAQTNNWTSPASGHWEDSTWLLGIPPAAGQSVMITNAGSKAVGVFPTTPLNFPGTMTVSNLTISAPSNSVNTLLLNYAGTAVPLTVLGNCTIGENGSILNLSSSLWVGEILSITTNGTFVQNGGMTVATNWSPSVAIQGGTAAVTNGVFSFYELDIDDGGSFTQSGGSVSGLVQMGYHSGTYNLVDGFLACDTYNGGLYVGGIFNQLGGTNIVSNLQLSGTYILSGGLLVTSNESVFGSAGFDQSGGVYLAGGSFFSENYILTGGTLVASNLEIFGTLAVGPSPATISNSTSFTLTGNGTLELSNCTLNLAPLVSPGNGTIQFSGNDKLTFADSSTQSWNGSLTISNWNGSTSGGGADQLVFGGSRLTLRQLERIAFVNPAGFAPGTWLAAILPTGEVVPTTSPTGPTQPNLWTSPVSGHWEDSTWSLGVPPASNQTVLITNTGLKAVAISSSTPVNFPATMTVGDLFISGPVGGSNTLLLNFAGTNVPLQVINDCTVGTNGSLENLYSGLVVGGDLAVTNGSFVQVGGVTEVTDSFHIAGGVEVTNPVLLLVSGGCSVLPNGRFVQEGGLTVCSNSFFGVGGGSAFISNATMVVSGVGVENGDFRQTGGSLNAQEVDAGDNGGFYFGGGTAVVGSLGVGGGEPFVLGNASVAGGVMKCTNISVFNGSLNQSDGQVIVDGGVGFTGLFEDYGPPFRGEGDLSGGILASRSFSIYDIASFTQSGGTNTVGGDLSIGEIAGYDLQGGLLCTSNTFVSQGNEIDSGLDTHFTQSGGTHWVTNLFSLGGFYADYRLTAGTLIASNIVLADQTRLIVGASPAATISNGISFAIQGSTLELSNTVQALGALILSPVPGYFPDPYSYIDFTSGNNQVRFADSSGQKWDPTAVLYIDGWNGSASGGGADQIIFGKSASGLTPAQLQQIYFQSPVGFPPGTWFAKILPTGEVVPTTEPSLTSVLEGTNLVINWPAGNLVLQAATNVTGPFEDISNAAPPFTNDTTEVPRRFFRLRSP